MRWGAKINAIVQTLFTTLTFHHASICVHHFVRVRGCMCMTQALESSQASSVLNNNSGESHPTAATFSTTVLSQTGQEKLPLSE